MMPEKQIVMKAVLGILHHLNTAAGDTSDECIATIGTPSCQYEPKFLN